MKNAKFLLVAAFLAVSFSVMAASSRASTVLSLAEIQTIPTAQVVAIHAPVKNGAVEGQDVSVYTGPYKANIASATNGSNLLGDRVIFCIDLSQWSSGSYTPYLVQEDLADAPLPGITGYHPLLGKATKVQKLFDLYYDTLNVTVGSPATAAFQVALWEICYDGADATMDAFNTSSSTRGDFYTTNSTVGAAANVLLAGLTGTTPVAHSLVAFSSILTPTNENAGLYQDYIYVMKSGDIAGNPVPEPTTFAAWIGLALTLGAGRLLRRRSKV